LVFFFSTAVTFLDFSWCHHSFCLFGFVGRSSEQ
jgi:hypothetical protein